jgi:hypothetical protein
MIYISLFKLSTFDDNDNNPYKAVSILQCLSYSAGIHQKVIKEIVDA